MRQGPTQWVAQDEQLHPGLPESAANEQQHHEEEQEQVHGAIMPQPIKGLRPPQNCQARMMPGRFLVLRVARISRVLSATDSWPQRKSAALDYRPVERSHR